MPDMFVVAELDIGQLKLAKSFAVNLVVAIDHDLGDGRIPQERFDRTEPENLIGNLGDKPIAHLARVRDLFGTELLLDEFLHPAAQLGFIALFQEFLVNVLNQVRQDRVFGFDIKL